MTPGSVDFEISGGVATIALNDPDRRNALSLPIVEHLVGAIDAAEREGVGALVLTGRGSAFCAGADLALLESADPETITTLYRAFTRIVESEIPSIAAVNGPAVGAGLNMALACDIRIASRSAVFEAGFLRLDVLPGGGNTWMLHRSIGSQGAIAMTLFQEPLDGPTAERVGLIWRCVDAGDLESVASELAARVASKPPELVRRLMRTLAEVPMISDHPSAVQRELGDQLWSLNQPEAHRAIAGVRQRIRGSSS